MSEQASPQGAAPSAEGVALFVDWESFKWQMQHTHDTPPDVALLIDAADEYGTRGAARAYGNWKAEPMKEEAKAFQKKGVRALNVPGRATDDNTPPQNSADVRLAAEAIDLCHTQPHLTTFVLVSGDGDLIHTANILKSHGRKVVIIGLVGTVDTLLSQTADDIIYYDRDLAALTGEASSSVPTGAGDDTNAQTAYSWVEDLLRQAKGDGLSLAQLEHVLVHLYHFNPQSLDTTFKDFIKQMQQAGRVKITKVDGKLRAKLPSAQAAAPEDDEAAASEAPTPPPQTAQAQAPKRDVPQEIQWVLEILKGSNKPQPLNNVIKTLRQQHDFKPDKSFQTKIKQAQQKKLLKMAKNKKNNQWYIAKGERAA